MFFPATIKERRQYYREEWAEKDLPKFITDGLSRREFGFDHQGRGPNDRYKTFQGFESLRKFLRHRSPFAAYISVAFYNNPRRRADWIKSEFVFDVDAKDLPIRSCNCEGVCEICLGEALYLVNDLIDTLKFDLGLKNIHIIYSGRGYHIRILDENVMEGDSDLRAEVLKYVVGAKIPRTTYSQEESASLPYNLEHFSIPIAYPALFTKRLKLNIQKLTGLEKIDGINPKLLKDIIKFRQFLDENEWGLFKSKIGPIRYKNMVSAMASLNLVQVDSKVSIDLKRILRLPSSLHSKVSMKCVEVKNPETFDPFKYAVPKFVEERKS